MTPRHLPTHAIFIVEDHEVLREVYSKYLECAGPFHVCGTAESAEEALRLLPDLQPDAVLIDISLPGMSGLELVEHILERWPELPTIVVSGHDNSQYRRAALKAGARDFVTKGEAELILESLRKILSITEAS